MAVARSELGRILNKGGEDFGIGALARRTAAPIPATAAKLRNIRLLGMRADTGHVAAFEGFEAWAYDSSMLE